MVITEETTHPLAAPHAAALRLNLHAVDQFVAKPLMVALGMVMATKSASARRKCRSPNKVIGPVNGLGVCRTVQLPGVLGRYCPQ